MGGTRKRLRLHPGGSPALGGEGGVMRYGSLPRHHVVSHLPMNFLIQWSRLDNLESTNIMTIEGYRRACQSEK